jgi:hypothetical protein
MNPEDVAELAFRGIDEVDQQFKHLGLNLDQVKIVILNGKEYTRKERD